MFSQHWASKIYDFVFIFNLEPTYHAASPPGSEQERLEYALTCKRRALILALRWANTHTFLLQEEPAAISFLEVNMSEISIQLHNLHRCSAWSERFFPSVSVGVIWKRNKWFSDAARSQRFGSWPGESGEVTVCLRFSFLRFIVSV